jgi:ribosome-binding ATPase YchF (GTP1/OBG family)
MAALIHSTRQIMKQITFYTIGKPGTTLLPLPFFVDSDISLEAKAYSIPKGITIREAAGHIHSDFEKVRESGPT